MTWVRDDGKRSEPKPQGDSQGQGAVPGRAVPEREEKAAAALDAEALMDRYYEVSMEGVDLKGFLQRLDRGEWGPVDAQAVVDFLRQLQALILANIDVKAQEGPHYAQRLDEVIQEVQREFDQLVARYLQG